MAWDIKYRGEFTDILGLDWKIEIEDETAHVGNPDILQFSGFPLTIIYLANGDTLFDAPIHGSKVDFIIESDTHFKYASLYTTENMQYRVKIYHSDTTLYWQGYIITDNYSEPYDSIPYFTTVSASCGLGLLKEIIYKDGAGDYYNGRLLASEIIIDILAKIKIPTTAGDPIFTEFVNIYEESMTATATYSPFDQIKIDVDVFRDMYCYEVLEEILKPFNACIRIIAGQPTIYRPIELVGATVYGRIFTGDATHTGTIITPEQLIKRTGIKSDIRDVNSGTLMIQSPAKKVTIFQDYGNKESWVKNWKFEGNTFSGGGAAIWTVDKWVNTAITLGELWPIGVDAPSESDGVLLANANNYPSLSKYISQSFGSYGIISATDAMCLEFEYQWFNHSAAKWSQVFYFQLRADNSNYSLSESDGTYAEWVTPAVNISITEDVEDGSSGWKTWRRLIDGLDIAGPFTIKFYCPDDTYFIGIGIRNVKFTATNDLITRQKVKKRIKQIPFIGLIQRKYKWVQKDVFTEVEDIVQYQWIGTNAINGNELEYDVKLGDVVKTSTGTNLNGVNIDNIIEQFAGSLATNIRTLLYRVDTITLTCDSTPATANITCKGVTRLCTFDTTLAITAENFADNATNIALYTAAGIQPTHSGDTIIFTSIVLGASITDTAIENVSGGLDGLVDETQPDAYTDVIAYSTDWNTRTGPPESKELLSIIKDELTYQHYRPKHFLNLPIMEDKKISSVPHVNILGNFQDSKNKIGGNNRIFVFNQGSFDVRNREWNIDLIEII